MPIAYLLSGPDNGSHMCGTGERLFDIPGIPICSTCGYRTDFYFCNPCFEMKRRNYDLSYTYDSSCIVSLQFKEFCQRKNYLELHFQPINSEPTFFLLSADRTLTFDADRRHTRFGEHCLTCHNYKYTVGATPVFLKDTSSPIESGIFRTDLFFGDGNAKSPLLIVGLTTYADMKNEHFQGLEFRPIEP